MYSALLLVPASVTACLAKFPTAVANWWSVGNEGGGVAAESGPAAALARARSAARWGETGSSKWYRHAVETRGANFWR